MRKVLIIGLGGSGGKTLGFLMDELRFALSREGWHGQKLPACWQFLHLDVPGAADAAGVGLAANVESQGGRYLGLAGGVTGGYTSFSENLQGRLESTSPSELGYASRWLPDDGANAIDIKGGAGAFRAVGRVVTLSKANEIHQTLTSIIEDLSASTAEATEVGRLLKFENPDQLAAQPPLVFIVSSLSGGSGASMVFDVSDIVRSLTVNGKFDGEHVGAFLYTADVFKALDIFGAAPGSLATISELINSGPRVQEGWTAQEWSRFGIGAAVPRARGRGPSVVFPIGGSFNGVDLGKARPEDVYRAFSRTLAPVFIDEGVQTFLFSYMMTNFQAEAKGASDNVGISSDPVSGATEVTHFASIGSATLSLGRERFEEYAAQRIAREAVEVLVSGHMTDKTKTPQEMIDFHADALQGLFWSVFRPARVAGGIKQDPNNYIEAIFSETERQQFAQQQAREVLSKYLKGMTADNVAGLVRSSLERDLRPALEQGQTKLYKNSELWVKHLHDTLEEAYLRVAATQGLSVANESVSKARKLMWDEVGEKIRQGMEVVKNSPSAPNPIKKVLDQILSMGKTPLNPGTPQADQLIRVLSMELAQLLRIEAGGLIVKVLQDFEGKLEAPLVESGRRLNSDLSTVLQHKVVQRVQAAYRDAHPVLWPGNDGAVPGHFSSAVNEILIEDPETFPATFDALVQTSVNSSQSAVRLAAAQIITRRRLDASSNTFEEITDWETSNKDAGPYPHLDRESEWLPQVVAARVARPASSARYKLRLTPDDLIGFARHWVSLPNTPIKLHTAQGIAEWAQDPGLSLAERSARLIKIQSSFVTAAQAAAPLVDIDEAMVSTIHGSDSIGIKYNFSRIPFEMGGDELASLESLFRSQPQAKHNSQAILNATNPPPVTPISHVFISTTAASPYLPMAFRSLTQPIRDSWKNALSNGTDSAWWTWRRARPLLDYVPANKRWVAAFMQGWIIGRLTGRIQLEDIGNGREGSRIRVYGESEEFVFDEVLLGTRQINLRKSPPHDTSAWNIPAVLLESLSLAVMQCQGGDVSPLKPFLEIVKIGKELKYGTGTGKGAIGGSRDHANDLDDWYNSGKVPGGRKSQIIPDSEGLTPEERKTAAQVWLSEVKAYFVDLQSRIVKRPDLWKVNRDRELLPAILDVLDEVLAELSHVELGKVSSPVTVQANSEPDLPPPPLNAPRG